MENENVNDEELKLDTADFRSLVKNELNKQFKEISNANLFYMCMYIFITLKDRGWSYKKQNHILNDFLKNGILRTVESMEREGREKEEK